MAVGVAWLYRLRAPRISLRMHFNRVAATRLPSSPDGYAQVYYRGQPAVGYRLLSGARCEVISCKFALCGMMMIARISSSDATALNRRQNMTLLDY